MFNPYIASPEPEPLPKPLPEPPRESLLPDLKGLLSRLDRDDLMVALLVYLLSRREFGEDLWPLMAAGLFLLL